MMQHTTELNGLEIAVIGMSARLPGANNIAKFWHNIVNGVESVSFFSDDELRAQGVPEHLLANPNYVKAKPYIADIDCFDADFFGYTHKEAIRLDPKIRVLHEVVYHALEDAGYHSTDGLNIGFFAGASEDIEWLRRVLFDIEQDPLNRFESGIMNHKDLLAHFIAYKLNLQGPAYTLYTSCSTSLAATHLACRSLLLGECELAIAAGVTIDLPQKSGYLHQQGMIHSTDGHCRPFDQQSTGTLFGDGAGAVVLKRYEDALADNDDIVAVIKASASNNDGLRKAGFTAPSRAGQTEVIRQAIELAEIDSDSIGYIETHGTATRVGDPVEFDALVDAFDASQRHYCALGAVKANIGHTHAAAGIAGLIKVALCVKHGVIPPLVNFGRANDNIKVADSPFYFPTTAMPWPQHLTTRRAGVSSFGIGGTNVHLVVEALTDETANDTHHSIHQGVHILPISAKNSQCLQTLTADIQSWVNAHQKDEWAKAAYTLQVGRAHYNLRAAWILTPNPQGEGCMLAQVNPEPVTPGQATSKQNSTNISPVLFVDDLANISDVTSITDLPRLITTDAFTQAWQDINEALSLLAVPPITLESALVAPQTMLHKGCVAFAICRALQSLVSELNQVSGHGVGQFIAAASIGLVNLGETLSLLMAVDQGDPLPQVPRVLATSDGHLCDVNGQVIAPSVLNDAGYWANLLLPSSNQAASHWLNFLQWSGETDCQMALAQLWCRGSHINWDQWVQGNPPGRISLPLYPFFRDVFAIPEPLLSAQGLSVESAASNITPQPSDHYKPRPAMSDAYKAPSDEVMRHITQRMETLLEVSPVGVDDHFFELGGHSLMATQLMTQLEDDFAMKLDFYSLMLAPSVSGIHQHLIEHKGSLQQVNDCLNNQWRDK